MIEMNIELESLKDLVTLVPVFKDEQFSGCLSVTHPLELKGVSRTF